MAVGEVAYRGVGVCEWLCHTYTRAQTIGTHASSRPPPRTYKLKTRQAGEFLLSEACSRRCCLEDSHQGLWWRRQHHTSPQPTMPLTCTDAFFCLFRARFLAEVTMLWLLGDRKVTSILFYSPTMLSHFFRRVEAPSLPHLHTKYLMSAPFSQRQSHAKVTPKKTTRKKTSGLTSTTTCHQILSSTSTSIHRQTRSVWMMNHHHLHLRLPLQRNATGPRPSTTSMATSLRKVPTVAVPSNVRRKSLSRVESLEPPLRATTSKPPNRSPRDLTPQPSPRRTGPTPAKSKARRRSTGARNPAP
jgi:hypothetical protein